MDQPFFSEALAGFRQVVTGVFGPTRPEPGQSAAGHGVTGKVAVVADRQPLAADGIWRVTLAGEAFGRLVRRAGGRGRTWRLLQIDDLTDAQLDAYEAGMHGPAEEARCGRG